jgi:hypothetical protein
MRALILVVLIAGCAEQQGPCAPKSERALIGARYEAELAATCPDHTKPLSQCPGYKALHDRYLADRESWVTCSKN